jgi:DNA-binding response OmpR family regulator
MTGPEGYGLRLAEHVHAGHIYESADEQASVSAAFFSASLNDGRRCVYVHNHSDNEMAVRALVGAGLDVTIPLQTAALEIVDRRLLPTTPGDFDAETAVGFVRQRIVEAIAEGYQGVRGVGDMDWTSASDPTHERLMQYESLLTAVMHSLPCAAICQYERGRFEDTALFDVIYTHPWLVIGSTVCQNPYYIPNSSFEERDYGALELDQALSNVLLRERQERWLATESDLKADGSTTTPVDVRRLAAIYEHMRDYKAALRERVSWRLKRQQHEPVTRCELAALDGEIEWLERRASLWRRRELQSSGLVIDPVSGTLVYRGRAVGLSRLEVSLLQVLMDQAGQPIHAAQLVRVAWDRDVSPEAQLRNYIGRLRSKLEMLRVPVSIVAQRGRGYQLVSQH